MNLTKQQNSLITLLVVLLFSVPFLAFAENANFLERTLWVLVNNIFGVFVSMGAMLLNTAINSYVIGFGTEFNGSGVGQMVTTLWTNVRDLFNLTFIFGLVYIGFKMILDSDDSGTRRWLVSLILAALLVNFSLFITKFIIDISNILASEIVQSGFTMVDGKVKVSDTFMDITGLQSTWGDGNSNPGLDATDNKYMYIFGTAILFMITAFVFAAGGMLLIIRYVVLLMYMIFSPLMFLGSVFPQLRSISSKYWHGFLGRVFFAPLYVLLVFFSAKMMQASVSTLASPDFQNLMRGDGNAVNESFTSTLIPFIISSTFLIASLVIANKMGADGAGAALKYGQAARKKVQQNVVNGSVNGSKWALSQTFGRGGRLAAEKTANVASRRLSSLQNSDNQRVRAAARSNLVQGSVGGAVAAGRKARFGLSRTREQDRAMRNQTDRKADSEARQETAQNVPPIDPANANLTPDQITARQNARRQAEQEVHDMSNDEILERARTDREGVMSAEFASLLADAQVTALRNSGIFTNADMDRLEENRDMGKFAEIISVLDHQNSSDENLTAATDDLNRIMSTMSDARRQGMMRFDVNGNLTGPLTNNAVASRLTGAHIDTMRQSGRASTVQMGQITNSRQNGLITLAYNGSLGNPGSPGGSDVAFQERQRRALFRNAQEAGRLPVRALAAAPSYLTPRIIEEFLSNNPNVGDMDTVRNSLRAYLAGQNSSPAEITTWQNWSNNVNNVAGQRFALF